MQSPKNRKFSEKPLKINFISVQPWVFRKSTERMWNQIRLSLHNSALLWRKTAWNLCFCSLRKENSFDDADRFVAFGERIKCLSSVIPWSGIHSCQNGFVDKDGKDVSAEVLKQRMKNHITTVVSRYKGRVKGWDVVNEAIMEDGTYRKVSFMKSLVRIYPFGIPIRSGSWSECWTVLQWL